MRNALNIPSAATASVRAVSAVLRAVAVFVSTAKRRESLLLTADRVHGKRGSAHDLIFTTLEP